MIRENGNTVNTGFCVQLSQGVKDVERGHSDLNTNALDIYTMMIKEILMALTIEY